MVNFEGGGDKYHIVCVWFKIIDLADRKRVDETMKCFFNQRPKDETLQIVFDIVRSSLAAENAR